MKKFSFILLSLFIMTAHAMGDSDMKVVEFSDVSLEHVNYDAVSFMQKSSIIKGYTDGTFRPDATINRAELVKIILETGVEQWKQQYYEKLGTECLAEIKDEDFFTDVVRDVWYAPYVCYAKKRGLITGYDDNTFRPETAINLAEASKMLSYIRREYTGETLEGAHWYEGYMKSLEKQKALPLSLKGLDGSITRGDFAEMSYRISQDVDNKDSYFIKEIERGIKREAVNLSQTDISEIRSCQVLSNILMKEAMNNYHPYYSRGSSTMEPWEMTDSSNKMMDMDITSAAPESSPEPSPMSKGSSDYSTTNVQVKGVDEADVIKNDGKYIYSVQGDRVSIVQAYPADEMKEVVSFGFADNTIYTGMYPKANMYFYPRELFLSGDTLVVIGGGPSFQYEFKKTTRFSPYYRDYSSQAHIIDITDRSKPVLKRTVELSGNYNKTRRIGDTLYMTLNVSPQMHLLQDDPTISVDAFLPHYKDSAFHTAADDPQNMVECGDVKVIPGYTSFQYLVVAAIPLEDTSKKIESSVMIGSANNLYMSTEALYVATQNYNNNRWNWDNTMVYKFDLENKMAHSGSVIVPGRIINQFAMDEHDNHFRIATTKAGEWDEMTRDSTPSNSRLYVFDDNLNKTGSITGIAPGEDIYSVRFMGDRAFIVTFERVDPLFVIGLKDPKNPKILGELKIPGWSNYLHPYGKNHLIGFGKDVPVEIDEYGQITGSDVKGMKVSLFDVTDLSNPKEAATYIIGDSGTYSELLNNHKALMVHTQKNILAFPVSVQEKAGSLQCLKETYNTCPSNCQKRCIPTKCIKDENGLALCSDDCNGLGSCIESRYDRYANTFQGAVFLGVDVEAGSIDEKARVGRDPSVQTLIADYNNVQRIIYIGNTFYTVGTQRIEAVDMDTFKNIGSVNFRKK
ncbi:hypothetical protein COB57_06035 [Candidatus Peregrinibacteria bacterium]|nr:MAG: hypothetical protein COB57_06035 [Candidatus Peregrinibacteria bacterium]